METTTKILIGVGAVAATLVVVGVAAAAASSSAPSSSPPGTAPTPPANQSQVAAAGPYAPVTQSTILQPGSTYLVSLALPPGIGPAQLLAGVPAAGQAIPQGVSSLANLGVTVNQVWAPGTVPSNWPSTDTDPTRARASITYTASVPIPMTTLLQALSTYVAAGGQVTGATMFSTGS